MRPLRVAEHQLELQLSCLTYWCLVVAVVILRHNNAALLDVNSHSSVHSAMEVERLTTTPNGHITPVSKYE
jgi:hypothetical protein